MRRSPFKGTLFPLILAIWGSVKERNSAHARRPLFSAYERLIARQAAGWASRGSDHPLLTKPGLSTAGQCVDAALYLVLE